MQLKQKHELKLGHQHVSIIWCRVVVGTLNAERGGGKGGGGSGPEVQLEAGLIWPHFGNLGYLSLSLGNLGHIWKPLGISISI